MSKRYSSISGETFREIADSDSSVIVLADELNPHYPHVRLHILDFEQLLKCGDLVEFPDDEGVSIQVSNDGETWIPYQPSCTCDLHLIMREGCKCGAIQRERGQG